MNSLEKITYYSELYDLYKNLLTNKQRLYFEMYYFDDLSLKEIADNVKVSRNAIHLNITNTIQHLIAYEAKLSLYLKIKAITNYLPNGSGKPIPKKELVAKINEIFKEN